MSERIEHDSGVFDATTIQQLTKPPYTSTITMSGWKRILMDDISNLSITRVSIPIVMAISGAAMLLGLIFGLIWTASAKSTSLDQVITKVSQLETQVGNVQATVNTLALNQQHTDDKVEGQTQIINDVKSNQEQLSQQLMLLKNFPKSVN